MKVLLINPSAKNSIALELPAFVRNNEGKFPPLGLLYIASYLKKASDCEVKLLDCVAEDFSCEEIENRIRDFSPDVVGITAHTHNLLDVIDTVRGIKKINPGIHVSLGGPHAAIFPHESLGALEINTVIPGDGEEVFTNLVLALDTGRDIGLVKGLFYRKDEDIIYSGDYLSTSPIDSLPYPDRSLLDQGRYHSILGKKSSMTTMVSTRGCPYNCVFCSTPKGFYRTRSAKDIVDEMAACQALGLDEIHFIDDVFNADDKRVFDICAMIRTRQLDIKWSFRGRADKITREMLIALKAAGCQRIHLGVETSSDEGLKVLNKMTTIEEIEKAFKWARDLKIQTVAYFMIGCPHEKNEADCRRTINFAKKLDPDFALFNILMPYPSTELYQKLLKENLIETDYWRDFSIRPTKDFQPRPYEVNLSSERLRTLLQTAYRAFYFRPSFIIKMLKNTSNMNLLKERFKTGVDMIKEGLARE